MISDEFLLAEPVEMSSTRSACQYPRPGRASERIAEYLPAVDEIDGYVLLIVVVLDCQCYPKVRSDTLPKMIPDIIDDVVVGDFRFQETFARTF